MVLLHVRTVGEVDAKSILSEMQNIQLKKTYSFRKLKQQAGFTLVEVMVAMSIFAILITMGMQAVFSAMTQHHMTQNIRTVMDSLNFIMEDMARNIRLGTNIRCVLPSDDLPLHGGTTPNYYSVNFDVWPQSCPLGSNMIVFNSMTHTGLDGAFITYVIPSDLSTDPHVVIKQKGDDPTTAQVITPPEVTIDFNRSGFLVRGAETPSAMPSPDYGQPTVVIRLAGTIDTGGVKSDFALQTTVTMRALDPS